MSKLTHDVSGAIAICDGSLPWAFDDRSDGTFVLPSRLRANGQNGTWYLEKWKMHEAGTPIVGSE
jgi:hypothetical protein